MVDVSIRPAVPGDAAAIHALIRELAEYERLTTLCTGSTAELADALFGERARAMHKELNERYNDGSRYRLHYVTARQAYNIAKAAEAGHDGDPSQWLDYAVDTFDRLYEEGADGHPRLMSLGLHLRIIGRPGRIGALEKLIAHVQARPDVWCASRLEIAQAFAAAVPAPEGL